MDCIKMEVDSENYVFVRFSAGSGFWIGISGPEVFLSIIQLLTAVFTQHPFEKKLSLVKYYYICRDHVLVRISFFMAGFRFHAGDHSCWSLTS
jgi:hypothetical protein